MQSQNPGITIFHNPACGTSRNTLALIRNSGAEPEVIEYLKTPPSRATLQSLVRAMGISVRELLRRKGTPYDELQLDDPQRSDDELLDAMLAHPILINRPIVSTPLGTRLCRPSETVLDLLPSAQQGPFTKEDGEVVINAQGQRVNGAAAAADLPCVDPALFDRPTRARLTPRAPAMHPPRFLLLYGSLRERSFSRLATEEAGRILTAMGAEVRTFDPKDLPLADGAPESHPKVQELRSLAQWAEGMVWCSPERHGAMTGIMKTQIDWIPLNAGAVRPTQGKTLAVMQVSGGSQSFNAVNQLRVLGRWMRMITIPNQSSIAKAYMEFDEAGRMKPSAYYDRIVDVMEELFKFTLLTRDVVPYLVDRYSERKESARSEPRPLKTSPTAADSATAPRAPSPVARGRCGCA
jgi:arsenic resistance protein ArsH